MKINSLLSRHRLNKAQYETLCHHAEHKLAAKSSRSDTIYLSKADSGLNRALLIDYASKKFTILSKKEGPVWCVNGRSKKVSAGLEVEADKVKEVARLVNKSDDEITEREIAYQQQFGKVRMHAHYTAKSGTPKTTFTQPLFLSNLEEAIKQNQPYSPFMILKALASKLQAMHQAGVVHGDIKSKNILYRSKGVGLTDFGWTIAPKREEPYGCHDGYGTSFCTSPEHLAHNRKRILPDLFEQAKADDMYALGCVFYELIYKEAVPWNKEMENCFDLLDEQAAPRAEQLMQTKLQLVKQRSTLLARLLDPDPATRLKVDQLLKDLVPERSSTSCKNDLWLLVEACSYRTEQVLC